MDNLRLHKVGQIKDANITFGDLTVFVGPQASGKSIALQFLRLMVDLGHVQKELVKRGVDWSGDLGEFFDVYFGEGMRAIWRNGQSEVAWNGEKIDVQRQLARIRRNKDESLFFIPAQRVLALRDGWPRPFSDYSPGDPFAVRKFSEELRQLVEKEPVGVGQLFPQE